MCWIAQYYNENNKIGNTAKTMFDVPGYQPKGFDT